MLEKHFLLWAAPLAAGLLLISCNPKYTLTERTDDGSKVRLEAVTDDIIRVQTVPRGVRFSRAKSLSVLPYKRLQDVTITRSSGSSSLSTGKITAIIDKYTGRVEFRDSLGNPILAENDRSFTPIKVEGVKGYTVRQTFVPQSESFYGLGQHQADEWDWKGRNEELYQYNTKISVPFVVSSNKYGILWDSYSFCRWGDPRPYAQLGEVFTLRDKDGVKGALTGT
ncbi:MAG: DUF4968 domain-containing protein, partial [Bacteroidales bacterium]|nr:DUF4968 domain-containing protein [Bacteroidales bacterium]